MKYECIVVLITVSCKEEASLIARTLVEKKLAACVNTAGINSVFLWKNNIEKTDEVLLIAKTKKNLFDLLKLEVKKLHSYEVAEIIGLPVVCGSDEYLDWVKESTI